MATSTRGNPSLGDIVRSVVVLAGVLALVAVLFNALNDQEPRLPDPVDYQGALEVARAEYAYDVLAPEPVPAGWRATSMDFSQDDGGDRWQLGFLIDGDTFIGIEQTDGEIESYRDERLADFDPDGESSIDGVTWERLVERDDAPDRALVRVDGGAITIVRGTVPYEELEDFVTLLR
ncbi:DUF4245 domain-containing protein [Jiangella asiatica]|uniref:DUF4245 domain-containing protein n=1 Tax=Jiangella asiatica TaxID=2530372 RepID=A0A4R5DAT2_9ACTN|nr:DUF4245 domain-containing protein [Jiangella asiatica]TDE09080.1 DUF4245 domain-containing protein [Jiangella asiatica]